MSNFYTIARTKFKTLAKLSINVIVSPVRTYLLRKKLHNKDFTIIASNCIGAKIYQELGIEYNTPFVGLFINAPCYIKLIRNLDHYLKSEITFVKKSKYPDNPNQNISPPKYPIGLLGDDIEIHFVHYKSEMEVRTKWERRKKRMNKRNLFFIFTDRDFCTQLLIEEFDKLPHSYKICFTAQNYPQIKSTIWLPEYQNENQVHDLYHEFGVLKRHFNFVTWLNG